MMYGLLNLPWWGYIIAVLIFTHITIVSTTIYLHRNQSHRALDLHPIASHFFRFWLWLTTGMVTGEWVAIHRKHHAKTDMAEDPHSPVIYGIRKLLLEGAELYRIEAKNKETLEKYSHGTPDDWVEKKVYAHLPSRGIALMFVIDILLFGVVGITVWGIQMLWIPFFATGIINGIGHYFGYRNFEVKDASRNIVPWGILVGGEELHNNHHTYASSAKLSIKWWEFDIGWMYIKMLSWVKLAKIKKLPPEIAVAPGKMTIDIETVKAVIGNRFQVMSRYYRQVVLPVLKAEQRQSDNASKGIFKRAKSILKIDHAALSAAAKDRLSQLLQQCKNLKLVYDYRLNLQGIWSKAATNQKELIDGLQQWCKQAEASGVEVLTQFAQQLKSYVPKVQAN